MRNRFLVLGFFICILIGVSLAHQPRIVSGYTEIKNPEVSQAFYGNLNGSSAYFVLNSDKPFTFYIGILVPDLEGIGKDISVKVMLNNKTFIELDGLDHNWTYFFEEFAGDGYYNGPEATMNAEAGIYNIEVFSTDNNGKYVLVVGKKEEFPIDEFINTILTLPKLKAEFFEKPAYTAYFNLIGVFMLLPIAVISLAIYMAIWFYKKGIKKKEKI